MSAQADAKLVHSLDVMSSFSALRVEVPLTASAAPAAIAALSERKAHYLKKRAEVRRLCRHHWPASSSHMLDMQCSAGTLRAASLRMPHAQMRQGRCRPQYNVGSRTRQG